VLDRIFTRIGASDDIAGGQSTFMREMSELTDILHDATPESLVLLDEVGRGTSTADGLAIARATTEFVHGEVGATTLFATHYHDLTGLAAALPNAFNRHFTVSRGDGDAGADDGAAPQHASAPGGDGVTFLHRVADGPSSSSYGVEVAALAGVPDRVVERAREHLRASDDRAPDADPATATPSATPEEVSDGRGRGPGSGADPASTAQADRGDTLAAYVEGLENGDHDDDAEEDARTDAERDVLDALRDADIARTTPLEALNTLEDLQRRLDE